MNNYLQVRSPLWFQGVNFSKTNVSISSPFLIFLRQCSARPWRASHLPACTGCTGTRSMRMKTLPSLSNLVPLRLHWRFLIDACWIKIEWKLKVFKFPSIASAMAGALLLYLSIFYFVCSKSETSPDQKELYEEVRFYFTVDALILPLLIPGLRWECLSGPIQTHHENILRRRNFITRDDRARN